MMYLRNLSLHRIEYGDRKGQYEGAIKFDDDSGSLTVAMGNELSEAVLAVCADALRAQASKTAEIMCKTAIPQQITHEPTP